MTKYYFIGTVLPPLSIGAPAELRFQDCMALLQTHLTNEDWKNVVVIRRYYDIENMRRYWLGESIDPHGNEDQNGLVYNLLTQTGFPDYILSFLAVYGTTEDRLHHFPALIAAFFREEKKQTTGFLAHYLDFERTHRLIFLGFRAKYLHRDLTEELQYEDPLDPLVLQILAQKDAPNYVPPVGYEHLQALFEENANHPFAFFQATLEYRFHYIDRLIRLDIFSLQRILGYVIQLILVEQWWELDKKVGQEKIDQLVSARSRL